MRSSLARLSGVSAITPEQLDKMRLDAWRQQGVIVLRPDEINDPWTRRVLLNEAERRFGKRHPNPRGDDDGKKPAQKGKADAAGTARRIGAETRGLHSRG